MFFFICVHLPHLNLHDQEVEMLLPLMVHNLKLYPFHVSFFKYEIKPASAKF